MRITLALLAKPTVGGWPSFTAHLHHGLTRAGHEVQLVRLGNKTESKTRPFGRGISYRNVDRLGLNVLAARTQLIVTAIDKHHVDTLPSRTAALVIHDPTELTPTIEPALPRQPIITIRRTVHNLLQERGISNIFIPHPYARTPKPRQHPPEHHAVAYSRIDWDKGTHIIVEANMVLPPEQRVRIHGYANTIYAHHKLEPIEPAWRDNYAGAWPANSDLWHSVEIARSGRYAIDLSAISGDGGGTQYSFLEALDAGSPLIINSAWLTGDPELDTIAPYIHAAVTDPNELLSALQRTPEPTDPQPLLQHHDATRIAELITRTLHP